jgi:hypothetical protein
MFLNFLKNFILKRKLKNSLKNVIDISSTAKIKTIAILVDESSIQSNTELKEAIVREGILSTDIAFLTYKDLIKKNEVFEKTTFSLKDIDCNGDFINSEANLFLNQKFDLLISYYDVEKNILMMLTQKMNADFKVGFSTIDKRLNHFMINTDIQNQRIFVSELFKYLRILNKI